MEDKLKNMRERIGMKMNPRKPVNSFVAKVRRGPFAMLLNHGPLKNFGHETDDAKPDLKEVSHEYHRMSLDEICKFFSTSASNGLTSDQAKALLEKNGQNVLKPPEKHTIRKLIGYFTGGFCWILWLACIVCFLAWKPIGDPPDPVNLGLGIVFLIVIGLEGGFEAFQDFSSNKVMNSIKGLMASDATVIRNGVETKVPAADLVVGDIVMLTYGQVVPADLRIIESSDLKFDRAMLTGESEAVEGYTTMTDEHYTESKNVAFMATLITNGTGKAIVTLTAENTLIGSIAKLTAGAKQTKTTLQIEIKNFVTLIACFSVTSVVICIILWAAWIRTSYPKFINLASMLVNCIAIMVAYVPTGLPVSVTLSLLLVAKRMARNNVLVKNLTVIETLSCVTVIASDKTGTLTQNKMYVTNVAAGLTVLNTAMARRASVVSNVETKAKSAAQLLNTCILCNEAKFEDADLNKPVDERSATGGATDIAILKYGANLTEIEDVQANFTIIDGIPFNSRNKWMARIFKPNPGKKANDCFDLEDDECVITMKGAPDILIKNCKWIINDDGSQSEFNQNEFQALTDIQNKWCLEGLRVLLICKKIDKIQNVSFSKSSELESYLREIGDLCVLGMVGIIDKPREGIDQVIKTCRGAGVRVFMVTGDFSVTAAAIASQIGIFSSTNYDTVEEMKVKIKTLPKTEIVAESPEEKKGIFDKILFWKKKKSYAKPFEPTPNLKSLLLTGTDLEGLEDSDWRTITKYEEIVFARTTPSQKLRVVEEFKIDRNVVAVTGDGVNDSPALKAANIGIAMGGGSEVAMAAAQVVLLDNSFNSIVIAIEMGRLVFDNLRKVVLYLLPAGTFSEIVPLILNIYFGIPVILSAFQMVCICVITDLGPSLAMMLEKSEGKLLDRPPRVVGKDRLVDKKLLLYAYFFLGVFECCFSIVMYFLYLYMYGGFSPDQIFFCYDKWADGYLNKTQTQLEELAFTGQTVTFSTLIIIQTFGNIFITRTHYLSLFQSLPFLKAHRNLWLFVAMATSMGAMFILIYVPFFNDVFKTRPIPVEFYFIPLGFCVIFIALDEIRRIFVRRGVSIFVRTAW